MAMVETKALKRRQLLQQALGKTPLMTANQVAKLWGKNTIGKLDFLEYLGMASFRPMSAGRPAIIVRSDLREIVNWATSAGFKRESVEGLTLQNLNQAAQTQESIAKTTSYAKPTRVLTWLEQRGIVKRTKIGSTLTVKIQDHEKFKEVLDVYTAARRLAVTYKRSF